MVSNVVHFAICRLCPGGRVARSFSLDHSLSQEGPARDFTVEFDRSTLGLVARPWRKLLARQTRLARICSQEEAVRRELLITYPFAAAREITAGRLLSIELS
jgi:hypothetical protein